MRKQAEDVDWYVDLSERLERRESRRKWVILATCVSVPLALMGLFVLYVVLDRAGILGRVKVAVTGPAPTTGVIAKEVPLGPVSVLSLQQGDIRFPQLDNQGLMTTMNHFFREMKPERAEAFTVNRSTEDTGTVLVYRLMNIGTTDIYEFTDVPVKRVGGEWTITEEGWRKIRDALQARMKLRLGNPML